MRKFAFSVSAFALSSLVVLAAPAAAGENGRFSWTGVYIGGSLGGIFPDADRTAIDCNSISNIINTPNGITGSPDTCEAFGPEFDANITEGPSAGSTLPAFEFPNADWIANRGTTVREEDGFLYGVHLGVNQQSGSHVVGIEVDISGTSDVEESSVTNLEHFGTESNNDLSEYLGTATFAIKDEMDWLSTFRVRFGEVLSADGRFMGYLTGGLAVARVSRSVHTNYDETDKNGGDGKCVTADECFFTNVSGGKTFYQTGLVVGAGAEWAITDSLILGGQYLYTKLNGSESASATFVGDGGGNAVKRSMDIESDQSGFDELHSLQARLSVLLN